MTAEPPETAAVILAGGRSTRMGTNKAVLSVGGVRIIDRVVGALRPLFPEILVIANAAETYRDLGLPVEPDVLPEHGPLGGIYSGLVRARAARTFCCACDMPFLDPALIRFLLAESAGYDVALPESPEGPQPMHAVYAKTCLPAIERALAAGRFKITGFFDGVRVRAIPWEVVRTFDAAGDCFFNVNTPAELADAEARWARREDRRRAGAGPG
jgi:molybdopterin-guanine dinucleotide biosynthesis protein A